MVQKYKSRSQFEIPYSLLCPVYFYRYPNPLATHVISVDVLSREVINRPIRKLIHRQRDNGLEEQEEQQHVLRTTRLILKRGTLPKWAPRGLIRNSESWVLEESEIELEGMEEEMMEKRGGTGREMRSWTRNLDHTTVMAVTESNIFRERPKVNGKDNVTLKASYDVTSGISFGLLRSRIEKFGLNRVVTHVDSSREGIISTYARLLEAKAGISFCGSIPDSVSSSTETGQVSKRGRLRAALRPPFLDGDFVGPIARMKRRLIDVRAWWRGLDRAGSGAEHNWGVRSQGQEKVDESHLSPTELLRKRFLHLRDQGRAAFTHPQDDDDEQD